MAKSFRLSNVKSKDQQMIIEEVIENSLVKTVKSVKVTMFDPMEGM